MKSEDVFGIIVRAVGLWEFVSGAEGIISIFASPAVIFAILVKSAIGAILMFNADALVRATYQMLPHQDP